MLRTIAAPQSDPVTLEEAKAHLRVDFEDDNDLITGFIAAATMMAQSVVQRRFVTQTLEWQVLSWRRLVDGLPIAPVVRGDVIGITYTGLDNVTATLAADQYVVQAKGPTVRIVPPLGVIWPVVNPRAAEPIVIQFRAGEAVDKVAANIKTAIKMIVGHLYENRESVVASARAAAIELPQGAQALLLSETWE
ncbi:head-tail connector protein [Bradyrhizobium sp. SZCCHNRI2007]|uniref:head-tail connector protein n=1 Tax=Bradyrhizobium sp. SZCCHNRI2007 TaxID=3057281 RepID=UPI0028E7352F|nr:head-tail connector protein [Bradyrhizobium sp. SZCCHNRI2007]